MRPLSIHFVRCFLLLATLAVSRALGAPGDQPWDGPAFSADPAALLKAAQAVPAAEGADVVILLEEHRYTYDANGRCISVRRLVSRMITQAGVDAWGTTDQRWAPWYQQRPELRVRTITPDGRIHHLDPKTLAETPAREDRDIFSDLRVLKGPIPGLTRDAVVEEEQVVRDTAPFFDRGVVNYMIFARAKNTPALRFRLILEAPAALPLRYAVHGLPGVEPKRIEDNGQVRLTFEAAPGHNPTPEPLVPRDVRQWPQVAFTTGRSWQEVAARYSAIVDQQIQNADLRRLLPAQTPERRSTKEVAADLLARLRKEVRYAAVELGEAAIVPRQPAEVLERRFGDCKDQAALLVALLRASGVPAYLALINGQTPWTDPDPGLPGFGVFNHAIVYVPGPPALWIDPTVPQAGVGELPDAEEGRLALIAAPETTALIRTPESLSSDNRQVESRVFELAERGPARVIETTETWGARAQNFRVFFGLGSNNVRQELEAYVKGIYLAKELGPIELPSVDDPAPVRLRLEGKQASRGFTADIDGVVAIPLRDLFSMLPAYFSEEKAKEPRRNDVLLPAPFVYEWNYRFELPPGFAIQNMPPNETRNLGKARYSQEFRAEPSGLITATVRFDSGPRRMSPGDAQALRDGVTELRKAEPLFITFEQVGESLLANGKVRESLTAFRGLSAKHPQEALHHVQVARALLAAGLGDAARSEARRAVEVEPGSALAHRTLGYVLQHDLLGRLLKKGFDLEGAIASYRKACQLDPEDDVARGRLAILLEHNRRGVRYGPGSRLQEAAGEYRTLLKDDKSNDLAENLPILLMWMGEFKEMKAAAEALPESAPRRAALLAVAVAATDGAPAALKQVQQSISESGARRAALQTCAALLIQIRSYRQAAEILTAAAQGSDAASSILARAEFFGQLTGHEALRLSADDPRSTIYRFFTLTFSGDSEKLEKELPSLFSRYAAGNWDRQELEDLQRVARRTTSALGVPPAVAVDVSLGGLRLAVEGEKPFGYRIQVQNKFKDGGEGASKEVAFMLWEDGQYRLLAMTPQLGPIGKRVWDLAEKGDLDSARRWLDWARAEIPLGGGDDPLAGRVFPRFWTRGVEGDRDAILRAAASLWIAGKGSDHEKPLGLLQQSLDRAGSEPLRTSLRLALAQAYQSSDRDVQAAPLARQLIADHPLSLTAFNLQFGILRQQLRLNECRELVAVRMKQLPDDPWAIRLLIDVEVEQGHWVEADRLGRLLISQGKAGPSDWNNLAWWALYHPPVSEEALKDGRQAVLLTSSSDYASLHTLASLYAEIGKTAEALDVLWQALEAGGIEDPDEGAWYVLGRLAEQFDARESAAAAYRKLEKPKKQYQLAQSTYLLAQRRLAALAK